MLKEDICLDDNAFSNAVTQMNSLKKRTDTLRTTLEGMYKDLVTAVDTPAGRAIQVEAKDVLIAPINDMAAVLKHVSETLEAVKGTGYYHDIFVRYQSLNENIKFD